MKKYMSIPYGPYAWSEPRKKVVFQLSATASVVSQKKFFIFFRWCYYKWGICPNFESYKKIMQSYRI